MEHFAIKPYGSVKKGEKQKKRTSYVASSRIRALMGWLHGRQGDIRGYRNTFLNIILSTIQTSRGDGCDLLAEAMAINSQFAEPLRKSEVAACARACQKTAYASTSLFHAEQKRFFRPSAAMQISCRMSTLAV